mmetsp:Transcript_30765/g.64242  ORF Transcript_30765/g.64242 Transcript_30765/m.64242 type:complete len:261 (-) Transcript_30765:267-1049(-)
MKLTARIKQKYVGPSSTPPASSGSSSFLPRDEESALPSRLPNVKTSSSPSSRIPRVHRSSAPSAYNPIISLLRKLCSSPNSHNERDGTFLVNVLKDMIGGTILGIVFVFILLFLDYRNFIHLGSARVFREAAFQLLTDPQTVQSLEESLDAKFISTDVYDAIHREIGYIQKKVQEKQGEIAEKEKEIDGYRLEAKPIVEEFDDLIVKANELFELDKFCGDCKWKKKLTCNGRVSYIIEKYGDSITKARIGTLSYPQCRKE